MPFADLSEARLFYTDEGAGDPPVLFVHGYSCDSHDWMWQLPYFTERHRVVAVDIRGHGRSSAPDDGYTPQRFAADLAELLGHLGTGPVVAVGHSLGGVIVSALAVEHPDLVSAVVSVDPGYLIPDAAAESLAGIVQATAADPVAAAEMMLGPTYAEASPPHLKAWHFRRIAGDPPHVLHKTLQGLFAPGGLTFTSVCEPYLRRRPCPVLAFYADGGRAATEQAMGAEVIVWPGSGHWLHQERPAEFNALVERWISEKAGPGAP